MDEEHVDRQVSRLEAESLELDQLLEETVRIVHESNPKFHWTGIYELFPDGILRLGPFLGAATEHVSIPVGQGVCGSAVAEKRNKVISDVTQEANYLACSIFTKSELVVLIQKNGKIYAEIDIDSHNSDAFDQRTVEIVQKVADRLAIAYEARSRQVRNLLEH